MFRPGTDSSCCCGDKRRSSDTFHYARETKLDRSDAHRGHRLVVGRGHPRQLQPALNLSARCEQSSFSSPRVHTSVAQTVSGLDHGFHTPRSLILQLRLGVRMAAAACSSSRDRLVGEFSCSRITLVAVYANQPPCKQANCVCHNYMYRLCFLFLCVRSLPSLAPLSKLGDVGLWCQLDRPRRCRWLGWDARGCQLVTRVATLRTGATLICDRNRRGVWSLVRRCRQPAALGTVRTTPPERAPSARAPRDTRASGHSECRSRVRARMHGSWLTLVLLVLSPAVSALSLPASAMSQSLACALAVQNVRFLALVAAASCGCLTPTAPDTITISGLPVNGSRVLSSQRVQTSVDISAQTDLATFQYSSPPARVLAEI
jgi:hypothetical protein